MSRMRTRDPHPRKVLKCVRYDHDFDAPGYESESESSSSPTAGEYYSDIEIPPTYKGRYDDRGREQRIRPACGVQARNRIRSQTADNYSSTTYSSNISSPLENTLDTTETDPSELYTPISRSRVPRGVLMEEEISPVLHDNDGFVAPLPPTLRFHKEWRPQQTSTTTSLQPLFAGSKIDNGPGACSTPRSASRRRIPLVTNYNQIVNMANVKERPRSYYGKEKAADNFWDNTRTASLRSIPETVNPTYFKPESFGLHAAFAKNINTKGILFLSMALCGTSLSVTVNRAVYFLDTSQPQICSYVKLELRQQRKDDRKRNSSSRRHRDRPVQVHKTEYISASNKPDFRSTYHFELDPSHLTQPDRHRSHVKESLFISVWAMSAEHVDFANKKRMLGCMTFPISRLYEKALESHACFNVGENMTMDQVVVNDGGFFLLDEKKGEKTNWPQNKIHKQQYYDDPALSGSCGMTSSSYSSSNLTSSKVMPMEEFVTASRNFGSSLIPGYSTNDIHQLNYSSASSSTASREMHYGPYHGMHRATLPSITTTSDSPSEHDVYCGSSSQRQDLGYLYVDSFQKERKARALTPTKHESGKLVRRATSFTFSPKDSVDKYNKRANQPKEIDEPKDRNSKIFGPISKTISYIRNKMDTALSTSSLYPTRDEVREWETCFEALLNHKYGVSLFRQFLEKEHSEENLSFWQACEEFKRMKDGKKTTQARAQEIFREFVMEQANSEVNLDSDTRAATKAALESGCKTDTFSLAQSRIEQLMEKDSYRRFLKDPLYLDLLRSTENGDVAESQS